MSWSLGKSAGSTPSLRNWRRKRRGRRGSSWRWDLSLPPPTCAHLGFVASLPSEPSLHSQIFVPQVKDGSQDQKFWILRVVASPRAPGHFAPRLWSLHPTILSDREDTLFISQILYLWGSHSKMQVKVALWKASCTIQTNVRCYLQGKPFSVSPPPSQEVLSSLFHFVLLEERYWGPNTASQRQHDLAGHTWDWEGGDFGMGLVFASEGQVTSLSASYKIKELGSKIPEDS